MVRKENFICSICGSVRYDACYNFSASTIGANVGPSYYECRGCSVMFKDPDKFTVGIVNTSNSNEQLQRVQPARDSIYYEQDIYISDVVRFD